MDLNTFVDPWHLKWLREAPSGKAADQFRVLLETQQVSEIAGTNGQQLLVSPRNSRRHIAVLTSRLGRDLSRLAGVYHEMTQIVRRARAESSITLLADAHLTPIIGRLTQCQGVPLTKVSLCRTLASFWRRLSVWDGDSTLVSPLTPTAPTATGTVSTRVAAALSWADELHVPWIRPQSHLADVLARSLRNQQGPPIWIYSPFFPQSQGVQLQSLGARIVDTDKPGPAPVVTVEQPSWPAIETDAVMRWTQGRAGLVHCVRGTAHSRLAELSNSQLDTLLRGHPLACPTPGDTLKKIIRDNTINGSGKAIRGGHRVVCFSATPLAELASLHEFRRGRQRWDFSPFGIWIDRQWLELQGARPVVYGDEQTWQRLQPGDCPWFQSRGSGAADWTREREWRVNGDVKLNTLPSSMAFVLTPTVDDAKWLQVGCRWKVVAMDADDTGKCRSQR